MLPLVSATQRINAIAAAEVTAVAAEVTAIASKISAIAA